MLLKLSKKEKSKIFIQVFNQTLRDYADNTKGGCYKKGLEVEDVNIPTRV